MEASTKSEVPPQTTASHESWDEQSPPEHGSSSSDDHEKTSEYPEGWRLAITMFGLCSGVFCVALDNTIIATALPQITDEFHDLQDAGWFGSAYLLTTCAFQPLYGKLYSLFDIKKVYLTALLLFEVGSVICGAAPNSIALIVGRAISGFGSAGVFSGAMVIVAHSAPLRKRPVLQSAVGAIFGVASVAGPLLGGAFTDHATWRWCFYINLPIGAVTAAVLIVFLEIKGHATSTQLDLWQTFVQLDVIGTILFVPSIVSIFLVLQWGGTIYDWSSGRIIALLVIFVVLLIIFIALQIYLGETATIPPRIASQRTIYAVSFFAFCLGGAFYLLIYFLPIWFQAILGFSAVHSGVASIPLILSNAAAVLLAGAAIMRFGSYMPWVYVCVLLTCVGAGLCTTLVPDSSEGKWIGYQILYGFGSGCAFQVPQISAQVVLPPKDIPRGIAMTIFFQFFGAAMLVSVGNHVLTETLVHRITTLDIPGVDPVHVVQMGATELRSILPDAYLPLVVDAYDYALRRTFLVAVIVSCISAIGALGMEWKGVHTAQPKANASSDPIIEEKNEPEARDPS